LWYVLALLSRSLHLPTMCNQGIYSTMVIALVELQKSVCNDIVDSIRSKDLPVAQDPSVIANERSTAIQDHQPRDQPDEAF
jgi:hypothetical protein